MALQKNGKFGHQVVPTKSCKIVHKVGPNLFSITSLISDTNYENLSDKSVTGFVLPHFLQKPVDFSFEVHPFSLS